MPLVLGIDEAGYGPTLGPLVVGATLWRVSARNPDDDWWKLLRGVVRRAGSEASDVRLVVDDSKAAFERKGRGLASLERPVLAFAAAAGRRTGTLTELLEDVGGCYPPLGPWDADRARPLPLDRMHGQFTHSAERLSLAMADAGLQCCEMLAEVVPAEMFNQRIASTHNKGAVLVEQIMRLMRRGAALAGPAELHVHVDRLGGRSDYRKLLMDTFPERRLHELEISEQRSRYRLAAKEGDWFVDFSVDGDRQHMPIALASMLAKYLREALMECFNEWWRRRVPGLKPTAGYYTDAQRFLADIADHLPHAGVAASTFVRSR